LELTQSKYEVVGRVARVSMNRPRYKNAQSLRMLEEIDQSLQQAAEDPDVRVIVLRGEGGTFSAGHDLGTPEHLADLETRPYGKKEMGKHGRMRISWHEGIEFGSRWRDIPKPTIASIEGYCIFNAWFAMSTMDVVFAAEDALFLPGWSSFFAAPWDLGARKAKEIFFRRRFITAEEGKAIGFVNQVFPAAELDAAVMAYANEVADGDPRAHWVAKMAVNQMQDLQGYTTFMRNAFAIAQLRTDGNPDGAPPARIAGRRRDPVVQDAFQRAGSSKSEKKPAK